MIRLVLAFVVVCLSHSSIASAQEPFRVYFFDVGQGDAVFIRSPGGPNVLYDAGNSPARILAHLDAIGASRIDLVVASHNHADHIGGLAEVIRRYRPRFYLDNGIAATTLTYRRVLEAVQFASSQLLEPTRRQIRVGDNAFIEVLPPPRAPGWDQNNNAVGLVLSVGTFRLSLAGDAERRQWQWWQEHFPELLRQVLVHKASHHGSVNGDTAEAMSALSPKVVIVSVGQNNGYGHPSRQALRLYSERGSRVLRTDTNGTVIVEVDASGQYAVRVERGEGANPPPAPSATLTSGSPAR